MAIYVLKDAPADRNFYTTVIPRSPSSTRLLK